MTIYASDGTTSSASEPIVVDAEPEAAPVTPTAEPAPVAAPTVEEEVVTAEVVDADTLPAVQNAGAELDVYDGVPDWTHQSAWDHDWIDFEGDRLAFRVPKPAAVSGFSNAQVSKHVTDREKGDVAQLFLRLHLSRESYERVNLRMLHPDSDYDLFTLSRLMNAILEPGIAKLEAALKEATEGDEAGKDSKVS